MYVRQSLTKYIRMGITSLDIKNNLYVNNDKIINMEHVYYDHNPFFFCLLVV